MTDSEIKNKTEKQEVLSIVIISEQIELIDRVQKTLSSKLVINPHVASSLTELKNILSFETVSIIIVDSEHSSLKAGSVRAAIKELKQNIPILVSMAKSSIGLPSEYLKNGANLVCLANDPIDILNSSETLILLSATQKTQKKLESLAKEYEYKFNELYLGLADPICYLVDGVFIDCNPSFLRVFEVSDKEELSHMTMIDFVDRKSQTNFRNHLRKSAQRDLSSTPLSFDMITKLGREVEMLVMSKPTKYDDEDVVQLYLRSTTEGGGGGASLYDETTGLSNKEQMGFFIEQQIESFSDEQQGILAFILIKNYRDVWGSDSIFEAEKFIKAITDTIKKTMPPRTEISRYTDDGILMYVPGLNIKETEEALSSLVDTLDKLTPEKMERMVEPECYAGFGSFDKTSDYNGVISDIFRSARNLALSSSNIRVSEPTTVEVSKKDARRVEQIQEIIKSQRFEMKFQPIANLEGSEQHYYSERIKLRDEEDEEVDNALMFGVAERYNLTCKIDMWKISNILEKLLSMDKVSREKVRIFINLSSVSMKNPKFSSWLKSQIKETGIKPETFIFEFSPEVVSNAYTGAVNFTKELKAIGAQIAVIKIGNLSPENERVISDLSPDIIKLDIREIDTLDEREESEVMEAIKQRADEISAVVIAEYLESASQISRIWPYGITYVQGDGMTPLLTDMNFDFDSFKM